jgi:arabinofuranosyltransferase
MFPGFWIRRGIRSTSRLWSGVVPAALIAMAGAIAVLAFSSLSLIDDTYISVRYAYNLNAGLGLVYNPGEHVEGYSNLLWTLLLTVPLRLGLAVDTFAIVAGMVFGILAILDAWRILRQVGVGVWWSHAAIIPLAFNADYWLSVTNGLEGGLFSFLLLRTVYLVLRGNAFLVAGLCGGLLFITRPEGLIVVPVCALFLLMRTTVGPDGSLKSRIRAVLSLGIPWLAIVVLVTMWRLLYYHAWLPNTVVAKAPPHLWSVYQTNIQAGIQYWESFLQAVPVFVLGALVAPAFGWRHPVIYLALALPAIEVPTVLVNGGDWMPHYRLIIVYLPLLAVLLGVALEELASPYASS